MSAGPRVSNSKFEARKAKGLEAFSSFFHDRDVPQSQKYDHVKQTLAWLLQFLFGTSGMNDAQRP